MLWKDGEVLVRSNQGGRRGCSRFGRLWGLEDTLGIVAE